MLSDTPSAGTIPRGDGPRPLLQSARHSVHDTGQTTARPCHSDGGGVRLALRRPADGAAASCMPHPEDKAAMDKIPMTRRGFASLETELATLKSRERPAIIRAIAEAREHGDLSENAEYHAAREKQGFVEGRIKELESILSRSEVFDPAKLSGPIKFGATVDLVDEDSEEERTYQIVGEAEADIERGLLNVRSPLARALIGKEAGDSIDVSTPGGLKSYEILAVRYV